MSQLLAAIDIGSNTVHMLVAEVTPSGVRRVQNQSEWVSLGEVISREGVIPKKVEQHLVSTVRKYARKAAASGASDIVAFATESLRRVPNSDEVLAKLKAEAGVEVEIITPQREAEYSFRGSLLDAPSWQKLVFCEVGGGSIQIAEVAQGQISSEFSLRAGTGRLIAEVDLTQPASEVQVSRLRQRIHEAFYEFKPQAQGFPVLVSGGVARGIWRALHPDGDRYLHRQELEHLIWDTQRLTVEQIVRRYSAKVKRASTLLPGAMIYAHLLETVGSQEMLVSEYGVREGAILERMATLSAV